MAEGQPTSSVKKSFSSLFSQASPSPIALKQLSLYKDEHAVFFSKEDIDKLASPFKLSVVAKFSHDRPKLEEIRRFFCTLDLKHSVSVGHLDARHNLLQFTSEVDFLHIWTRGMWQIGRYPMRVFHWTLDFHVHHESFLAPIWISLPFLPIHFFDKHSLMSIVSMVGRPLFVDAATTLMSRPSVARVCVEMDMLRSTPSRVWVGMAGDSAGFWQQIFVENLPKYCSNCWRVGHDNQEYRLEEGDSLSHRLEKEFAQVEGENAKEEWGSRPAQIRKVFVPAK